MGPVAELPWPLVAGCSHWGYGSAVFLECTEGAGGGFEGLDKRAGGVEAREAGDARFDGGAADAVAVR